MGTAGGLLRTRAYGVAAPPAARGGAGPALLALAVGGLCGSLALLGGADLFTKAGDLLSVGYAAGLLLLLVLCPSWRLGLFIALWLGAPPFLEYELAWVAVAGVRGAGATGLRSAITYPVVTLLDLSLIVGLVLFFLTSPRPERAGPKWLVPGVVSFTLLGLLAALNALQAFPRFAVTAQAGLAATLRSALAVLSALALARGNPGRRETFLGLLAGFWLFIGQSLYVTFLKNGSVQAGAVEMTGLIAGPGATGSLLVLLVPVLAACAFAAPGKGLKGALAVSAVAGAGYALLTYSRAVYLGLLVAALVFFPLLRRGRAGRGSAPGLAVGLVAVLLAAGAVALASDYHAAKLTGYGQDLGAGWNLGSRLLYWSFALHCIRANPLLGLGPLMWGVVTSGVGITPHNAYLQYAAENGLLASAAWGAVILGCVALVALAAWRSPRAGGRANPVLAGGLAGVAGFLIAQLFDSSLSSYRLGVLFWTVLVQLTVISSSSFTASRPGQETRSP